MTPPLSLARAAAAPSATCNGRSTFQVHLPYGRQSQALAAERSTWSSRASAQLLSPETLWELGETLELEHWGPNPGCATAESGDPLCLMLSSSKQQQRKCLPQWALVQKRCTIPGCMLSAVTAADSRGDGS